MKDEGAEERRSNMESSASVDTGQRLMKWMEEGRSLASLVHGLLEETDQLRANLTEVEQECKRLRQENSVLQRDREDTVEALGKLMGEMLRPMNEIMQKIRGTQSTSPFERGASAPQIEQTRSTPSGVGAQ